MAEQWEGGVPEDVLARHIDQAAKNSAAQKTSKTEVKAQTEFLTVSEPFKNFCQLMWDKHAQISAVATNASDNTTILTQSHKKGAIFKM